MMYPTDPLLPNSSIQAFKRLLTEEPRRGFFYRVVRIITRIINN